MAEKRLRAMTDEEIDTQLVPGTSIIHLGYEWPMVVTDAPKFNYVPAEWFTRNGDFVTANVHRSAVRNLELPRDQKEFVEVRKRSGVPIEELPELLTIGTVVYHSTSIMDPLVVIEPLSPLGVTVEWVTSLSGKHYRRVIPLTSIKTVEVVLGPWKDRP